MFRRKSPQEKELIGLIKKFKKERNANEQVKLLGEMSNYVPELNHMILKDCLKEFTDLLTKENNDGEPTASILKLLINMMSIERFRSFSESSRASQIKSGEVSQNGPDRIQRQQKEKELSQQLLSHPMFLENLFQIIKAGKVYMNDLLLILNKMYESEGNIMCNWLKEQKFPKSSFWNLVNYVIDTKNSEAGTLLQKLSVTHPDVMKQLKPHYIPLLKSFPVATTLDLMTGDLEISESFPKSDFENWVAGFSEYTISDIELVSLKSKEIWNSEQALKIMLRTLNPEKMDSVLWINERPAQEFEVSQQVCNDANNSFNSLPINRYQDVFQPDFYPYLFVRLYVLSLCNPNKLSVGTIKHVKKLTNCPNEYVAAAALQCLACWALNFNLSIEDYSIYRIAYAATNEKLEDGLKLLYFATLLAIGTQCDIATAILKADKSLQYDSNQKNKIISKRWCFPHFKKIMNSQIPNIKLCDYNQAKVIIDFISDLLNGTLNDSNEEVHQENEIQN